MGDYNQNNRSKGGGNRFGGRGSNRPMHRAVCAECGNSCEVPFRPSGDRPVYCSNCFEKRGNRDDAGSRLDNRQYGKPQYEDRKPSFSGGGSGSSGNSNGQIVEQLKSLNAKLDKIIGVLVPNVREPKTIDPSALETKMTTLMVKEPLIVAPKAEESKTSSPKAKKAKPKAKKTQGVK